MSEIITALFLGDIIGQPGSRAIFVHIKGLKKKYNADFIIANCENAAKGFGITPEIANQFFSSGIDVLTSGNHIWQKREIYSMLENDPRLLRPANYPSSVPGIGNSIYTCKGYKIGVINLQGRVRLSNVNCPFRQSMDIIRSWKKDVQAIIIDFHAEAPEEKEALALYLDGKVSLVAGTHTHVQTADEKILPGGTAFITDVGMTGPVDSVIGFNRNIAVERSLSQMPLKMAVADETAVIQGVCVQIDTDSGNTVSIARFQYDSDL